MLFRIAKNMLINNRKLQRGSCYNSFLNYIYKCVFNLLCKQLIISKQVFCIVLYNTIILLIDNGQCGDTVRKTMFLYLITVVVRHLYGQSRADIIVTFITRETERHS